MNRKPFDPDKVAAPRGESLLDPVGNAISVSELNAMVRRALNRLPAKLAVAGELSNFTRSANGHVYFTLKDEQAAVRCVMWRSDCSRVKFTLADGLAVVAFGSIDVYEPRGEYQLYVTRLAPSGQGELELAFRQLCEKLDKLGWFAAERKRPIPRLPRGIGVVSSVSGAAVRDILRTLAIRWPGARVVIADARVQGEGAAESVAAAIASLNRHAGRLGLDVLIVARGGGSLEDLWGFNTECVAKAIRNSRLPVVSGVGHEVDTTIADLVADLRAATPTAAAQAVAPDARELAEQLDARGQLLRTHLRRRLDELARRVDACRRSELFRRPASLLRTRRQRLDEQTAALHALLRERQHQRARRLAELAHRLECQHPRAMLGRRWRQVEQVLGRLRWAKGQGELRLERRLTGLAQRLAAVSPGRRLGELGRLLARGQGDLAAALRRRLAALAGQLDARGRQIENLNPRSVLRRGYSLTSLKHDGRLLTDPAQATPGDRLITELASGRIESEVCGDGPAAPRPRRRARRDGRPDDEQMKLEF